MERTIDFILAYAGWIGLGLGALTAALWHRFVAPIRLWRIQLEWADVEAERRREHERRAADLKQAAQWQDARDADVFRIVHRRVPPRGDEAA